ncbi:MAG TPA: protein kinase [Kofleriaceae bacterium]|nr:protein kinase [Kofleriaceae bacterium]
MESTSPAEAPIDRYVVLEYLAEGGMGAIYLGKKMGAGGFEKQVVLKQLLPEFTRQPEFIDLFLREARLSATLDHANIIHTIDLVTAGEDYFIVMEYLDGADLRTLLRRCKKKRRRLSPAAGIYVARELLSALAYAHNKVGPDGVPLRLIHRDISPSNILISGSGEVKLTDFGIAKASTHNSVFYRVKGKVGYMSPEQAKSEPLDARSDLYSLAVCLFEMITGERLFVNVGLTTSADEMYAQPVPLISHKQTGLPPELDKVMLKALSRDPDHRYQTAGEFQEALLRCAHRHGLMMSAPDLAEHLRAVCGDTQAWRDDSSETSSAIGTELYEMEDSGSELEPDIESEVEAEGTDQIAPGEMPMARMPEPESDSGISAAVAASGQLLRDRERRRRRARTSITKLTELRGMALTSMINLAGNTDHAGSRPLIDFNDLAQSPMLPSTSGGAEPSHLRGAPGGHEGYPPAAMARPHPNPSLPPPPQMHMGPHPGQHMGPHPGPHAHGVPLGMPGQPLYPGPPMQQGHHQPGMAHPLAHPAVQPPLGSLAHIDPLEQTGIVIEPGYPPGMPGGPYPGAPGMRESGPMAGVPGYMPPGVSASMPLAGMHGPVGASRQSWAAMAPAQRPWLLLAIIFLVGVGTAAVIGLSGPTIEAGSTVAPLPVTPAAAPTAPVKGAP